MDFIKISEKILYQGKIKSSSGEENDAFSADKVLSSSGYWSTKKRTAPEREFVIIDFEKEVVADHIRLSGSSNGTSTFPRGYRIEVGLNGEEWKVMHTEKDASLGSGEYTIPIPLSRLRFLRFTIDEPAVIQGKYFSEIGKIEVGLSGIASIEATNSTKDSDVSKLIDGDAETFWESALNKNSGREELLIDLGAIYYINKLVLASQEKGFPETFSMEASSDTELWTTVFQEKGFFSDSENKYFWEFSVIPARYIRLECLGTKVTDNQFGVRIAQLEIFSASAEYMHIHNEGDIVPHASVFQAGLTKLAKDGEITPGAVVQSTDGRLRDASTVFKGIVQLANDGDFSSGLVVQASDSRLQPATEMKPGIVRLAYNRESNSGAAVQSDDSRLQHADDKNFGIVRLCPDGEYQETSVVTGNDKRIQKATTADHGIVKLAENGVEESGAVVQSNDKRLGDATPFSKGIIRLAKDGEVSEDAVVVSSDGRLRDASVRHKGVVELAENGEDRPGVVVQANDDRLKNATTENRGVVELAENGEEKPGVAVQGNDDRLKDATTDSKGIVELAENGEDRAGVAVQGNDRRLKDATETSPGIMQFAPDGGDGEFTAVQGNDKRLKDATTGSKGIVELAENGEDRAGVAVQGNDHRLKYATTESKGIVEFAENGEDRPGVAVQGNDDRLRDATTENKGIVELAQNGEAKPGVAVQGDDRRLREATETSTGIVKLATDGGQEENTVVQGNDRRLKEASTMSKGIVELAEDGEDIPGVVVQGNDNRLKDADFDRAGIVRIARNGESREGAVVLSNDERLYDRREPLPHEHDYAPLKHDFNSHEGTLAISEPKSEPFKGITPPSDGSSVIYGKNTSSESNAIGVTGVSGTQGDRGQLAYGVLGHGTHVGVRGQAPGEMSSGAGVVGVSRFGAGGIFTSEHGFSLVADGFGATLRKADSNIQLAGDKKALLVEGESLFNGQIKIAGDDKKDSLPGGIVEMFEVDEDEYISPGDILIVHEQGKCLLSKSKKSYSRSVIGVVSGNPKVILDNSGKEEKLYPIALSGTALCKVDARNNPINPGDLIVSSETAGCGMCGKIDSFDKIGTVIGKALDRLDDGVELIPIFIMHS